MRTLHDDLKAICKALSTDLSRVVDKIEGAGNVISPSDLDYVDKLTHAIKSVKTTMAMMSSDNKEDSYNSDMISKLKSMIEETTTLISHMEM